MKEINEVFDALDVLASAAGKVYKDKKVDVADLPVLIDVAVQAKVFLDAVEGFNLAVKEAEDLDSAEQLAIVKRLFQVADKYESARKA